MKKNLARAKSVRWIEKLSCVRSKNGGRLRVLLRKLHSCCFISASGRKDGRISGEAGLLHTKDR